MPQPAINPAFDETTGKVSAAAADAKASAATTFPPDTPAEEFDPKPRRIELRYPSSFLALLLAGFIIASLPLAGGLISNYVSIDRLSELSQRAVYNAAQATQNARQLTNLTQALERSARFYAVAGEVEMVENYNKSRETFLGVLGQFTALPLSPEMRQTTTAIKTTENAVFTSLSNKTSSPQLAKQLEVDFAELTRSTQALTDLADQMIDRETENLRTYAAKSKNQVFTQMLMIVPSAMLLIAGFAYLLARPIRELDDAINRLGEGKLLQRIYVSGPRDIEKLGEQLDWLRQRLISLEDQKTRFFQHVSHELKTPLTALREGSDLLNDEVVGKLNEEQREVTRILKQNSLTLEKLIQDLLTYSQSQSAERIAQKTAMDIKPLQLKDLINEVVDTQKMAIIAKSLTIHRECDKTSMMGDAAKLRVVIDNLLSNAIKYSPIGGTIVIRLGKRDETAILEVLDDGPGISTDEREKIFDPFYRSKTALDNVTKGTGLGLAIVRDYVEMHHGTVSSIASTGARFRVMLPKQPSANF
jgi:two-component system, NtrC family, sensor histidine kinase GlrK